MDELERLKELKEEAIKNPLKTVKKKPCASCKKKAKEVKQVILPAPEPEIIWVPTPQDIRLAFAELSNMKGVPLDKREFINKVYSFIFNEDFQFDCGGCVANQGRKFAHYIDQLKD